VALGALLDLTWFIMLLCLVMGLGAWCVFWWSVRTGQFRDAEETARLMLELDLAERAQEERP
jgi:cbb3-type cytochrome oxidase maturation protein